MANQLCDEIWIQIARPVCTYIKLVSLDPETVKIYLKEPFAVPIPISQWCLRIVLAALKKNALQYFLETEKNTMLSTALSIRLMELFPQSKESSPLLALTKMPVEAVIKQLCSVTGISLRVTLSDAPPTLFVSYYLFNRMLIRCSYHENEIEIAKDELHESIDRWNTIEYKDVPFIFGFTCTPEYFQFHIIKEAERMGSTSVEDVSDIYEWGNRRDVLYLIILTINMFNLILAMRDPLERNRRTIRAQSLNYRNMKKVSQSK